MTYLGVAPPRPGRPHHPVGRPHRPLGRAHRPVGRLAVLLCALAAPLAALVATPAAALAHPLGPGRRAAPAIAFGSGSIAGTVTSATTDKGLAEVEVCAGGPGRDSGDAYCARTGSNGGYAVGGLPGGEYEVSFRDEQQNYVAQYYDDRGSRSEAEMVHVSEGTRTSGIDAALKQGGTIGGEVTSAATGKPLAGIRVCATPKGVPGEVFGECAPVTSATGKYVIERLETGEYTVAFWAEGQDYLNQFYDDESSAAQANPVTVTGGKLTPGIDAAMQTGGGITGSVTEARGGAPVDDAEVCATPVGEELWEGKCTHTEATGGYAIDALQTGEYTVTFLGAGDLLTQYYDGRATRAEAEAVKVTAGLTDPGIDAALQEGGKLAGTVTNAETHQGIQYIEVCAQLSAAQGTRRCAGTNAGGEYTIEGLAAGSYVVEFRPWSQNYLADYYEQARYEDEAKRVSVAAGATVTGIDAALEPGGEITGTVTSASTGLPIEGAQVCARGDGLFQSEWRCVSSSGGGHYTIDQLETGVYTVEVSAAGYADEYYDEATTRQEAEVLGVLAGGVTSGIDVALLPGGAIEGTVTSAASKAPLAGIEVCAYTEGVEGERCTHTGSKGEYTLTDLAAGEYRVWFSGSSYPPQYYGGFSAREASLVDVEAGRVAGPIDVALRGGGAIAGAVSYGAGGAPAAGIGVCAGGGSCTRTEADGSYTISGLAPGKHQVSFEPPKGYLIEADPEPVLVSAEATTGGVDATLVLGGRISGRVQEAGTGAGLAGVSVCAYAFGLQERRPQEARFQEGFPEEGLFGACATSAADGSYVIEGLSAGEWAVGFVPPAGKLAPQFFNGAVTLEEATPVALSQQAEVDDVDATLSAGGEISGTVSDGSGAPLEGVEACARSAGEETHGYGCADTDAEGGYTIKGLAGGSYLVAFHDYKARYLSQYYEGAYWQAQAKAVSVTAGAATADIDARLRTPGELTGTVRDAATGQPLAGIEACANLHPPAGEVWIPWPFDCDVTGTDGEYTLPDLPQGEYEVAFTAPTKRFARQVTGKLQLGPEQTLTGVDVAMEPAGSISGRVSGEAGEPLAGISVCASEVGGEGYLEGCAETGKSGDYTIGALAAGEYHVGFEASHSPFETPPISYAPQYYKGVEWAAEADPVTVAAGANVPGVDAQMAQGGEITGVVSAATNGEGLEETYICATAQPEASMHFERCAFSGAGGRYTLADLPAGSYVVHFSPFGPFAPEFYRDVPAAGEAKAVVVAAGATVSAIDAALPAAGSIRGKVTALAGGKPIHEAEVCAERVGGGEREGNCASTALNGDYVIGGLAAGSYDVEFTDKGKYQALYYAAAPSLAQATPVSVSSGASSEGIDAALAAESPGTKTGSTETQTGGEGSQGQTGATSGGGKSGGSTAGSSGGVSAYEAAIPPAPTLAGGIATGQGGVVVTLRCAAASGRCLSATVTVSVVEELSRGHVIALAAGRPRRGTRTRRVVVGSATATLAAGRSERVRVDLNAAGRRLLARWGALPARVTVTAGTELVGGGSVRLSSRRR